MECCDQLTKIVFVYDDTRAGYAYNLHACDLCGKLVKKDVWENKGKTTILLNGEVIHERT